MHRTAKVRTLSRRQFLQASTTLAAGLAAAPLMAGVHTGAPKKVRIGVVGGNFGASFYFHEHPDCIVEAVSDLIPDRRQHLMHVYGCSKSYESLEKLIEDRNVEAVAVFTPAPDHAKHSVACLKAGKHVLCAVPACMSVAEAEEVLDMVRRTGLTYMLAETSWYHQSVISARKWYRESKFGSLFYTEADYHHPGLEVLFFDEKGNRTWRHGFPPLHYPTHCTGYLVGVTGERMTQVCAVGWGDDSPILKDNVYKNPFWNGTAFFTTNRGNAFRIGVYWKAAVGGCERGQWIGDQMSFYDPHPNGVGYIIRRASEVQEKDDAGFVRTRPQLEQHQQTQWWKTDMLPEPLRHPSGHDGSHTFLTHEFVDALVNNRKPEIDIDAALALTVPGIIAHQSALQGGKQLPIPQFALK